MALPPLAPPPQTMDEYPPLRRIRFRLWQIGLSATTVLLAAWCYTLGPLAAIVATCIAKHVLVAILAAGLDLPDDEAPLAG
jgi:hypothetical protein